MNYKEDDFISLPRREIGKPEIPTGTILGREAWSRFCKNPLALGGLIILGLMILYTMVGPWFSNFDYRTNDLHATFLPPSWIHPMGTDGLGRDILSRSMLGLKISLLIGFGSVLINFTIGILYGGISGYYGDKIDHVLQRILDIIFSIPGLLYVILLMVTFGPGLQNIFIVLGLVNWMPMARMVRGQILALREQEFILAALALGAGPFRIITRHLLPNCAGQIMVVAALQIPEAIFMESFLSFIGLGVQLPVASLGLMVSEGRLNIPAYPYALLFPAGLLAILLLAFNFVGDGLRDAFDPRLRK